MKPQDMHRHPFNNQNIAIVEMQFASNSQIGSGRIVASSRNISDDCTYGSVVWQAGTAYGEF
jgi:hypothetical protein